MMIIFQNKMEEKGLHIFYYLWHSWRGWRHNGHSLLFERVLRSVGFTSSIENHWSNMESLLGKSIWDFWSINRVRIISDKCDQQWIILAQDSCLVCYTYWEYLNSLVNVTYDWSFFFLKKEYITGIIQLSLASFI